MIKKILKSISIPALNSVLIGLLIIANSYFQIMCIPSDWAIIVLIICFLTTILYPILLQKKRWESVISFVNGISVSVFIYCIFFIEQLNLYGLAFLLIGIGILVFVPHYLAFQLIWRYLVKPVSSSSRKLFLYGITLCLLVSLFAGFLYYQAEKDIKKFEKSGFTSLNKSFMTEKILGMHFIYHTRYCEFDGWRPPIHEPFLIVGMWFNGRKDPLNVDLQTRLKLYKKFFPENNPKKKCSCGLEGSQEYFNDSLWK